MIYNADLNNGYFFSLFYLNSYYGITQNPITKDFIIIMKYYKYDLKRYIMENFYNIDWNKKLEILDNIVRGLDHIHDQGIIHRDLHSGNILCENELDVVISDFGLSKSATESSSNDNENYGIIPYMAPEIFKRQKYTTASDVYSFGMIMWELMTGRMPFWDQAQDTELIIDICDGLRPPTVTNASGGYIDLMQTCWDSDPNKRPTSDHIINTLFEEIIPNYNAEIAIVKSLDIGPITINDSRVIHKSRPLSVMISPMRNQSIILKLGKYLCCLFK